MRHRLVSRTGCKSMSCFMSVYQEEQLRFSAKAIRDYFEDAEAVTVEIDIQKRRIHFRSSSRGSDSYTLHFDGRSAGAVIHNVILVRWIREQGDPRQQFAIIRDSDGTPMIQLEPVM